MAGIIGSPRSFHKKFKFVVEIDGFASAAFQKCSELSMEVAKVEQNEGGSLIPDKSPGRVTYTDIQLDRGATKDKDFFTWMKEVVNVSANAGLVDAKYKRNVDLVQQDRDGKVLRRWRITGAWPTKQVAGEWDNDADENVIESLTLTYDFYDLVQ